MFEYSLGRNQPFYTVAWGLNVQNLTICNKILLCFNGCIRLTIKIFLTKKFSKLLIKVFSIVNSNKI